MACVTPVRIDVVVDVVVGELRVTPVRSEVVVGVERVTPEMIVDVPPWPAVTV